MATLKIDSAALRDKIAGCFMGKNIGGTLGAPFECKRGTFDVSFYTQQLTGNPLPNDDLDLQLIWLSAVERYGRDVNAELLGEFWLQYIPANWDEYGIGKTGMNMGLVPPLSGSTRNSYKDSCGAYIRSEIWACLMPGHPEMAVRYAWEDASVDHDTEGVYGEIFWAAVQSAAFTESDRDTLIDIGLSYIPADCGIARGIGEVRKAHAEGADWKQARRRLMTAEPGSFGKNPRTEEEKALPVGPMGYNAPSNVGIAVLGWLYGGGDLGDSLCLAVNCGEDADCTAATLGATLGILMGRAALPARWTDPIGDGIQTVSVNRCDHDCRVPATVTELTERILRQVPAMLGPAWCDILFEGSGYCVTALAGDELAYQKPRGLWPPSGFVDTLAWKNRALHRSNSLLDAWLEFADGPVVCPGKPMALRLHIHNRLRAPRWLTVRWWMPEGWQATPGTEFAAQLPTLHGDNGETVLELMLMPPRSMGARAQLVLDIEAAGRASRCTLPVTLLRAAAPGDKADPALFFAE